MRIGDLAKAAGVHVQTIRFYERRRLIAAPSRSSAGYRDYAADTVHLVRFIKQVQSYGYALDEIRQLLALRQRGPQARAIVRERAKQKLGQIEAEIVRLSGIRDDLTELVRQIDRGAVPPECLVLRSAEPTDASASKIASRTRILSDPATGSERQPQRVSRLCADHHPSRLRRHRV